MADQPFMRAAIEEEATIGGLLSWSGPWPKQVFALEPEHFADQDCARVFLAVQAIRGDVGPIDVVDLRNKLREYDYHYLDSQLLNLMDRTPPSMNLDHWSGLVTDAYRCREIARMTTEAIERGEDAEQVAGEIQSALAGVETKRVSGLTHVSRTLPAVIRQLEQEAEDPSAGVIAKTNLIDVDKMARLLAGELTVIAGRPSMGKSSLAGNIASYCARDIAGGIVALFSLEMSAVNLIRRIISSEGKVDSRELVAKAKRGELLDVFDKIHHLNLYINDQANLGAPAMRADLVRFKDVRLVIVDYLQLAKHEAKLDRHDLRVGETVKQLKNLAKEMDCHVIALSQLNRACEQRRPPRPINSDLRDSGNIEEHADNIWFLYRGSVYYPDEPDNEADVIISKQRNGGTGRVTVYWNGATQTFGNLARIS